MRRRGCCPPRWSRRCSWSSAGVRIWPGTVDVGDHRGGGASGQHPLELVARGRSAPVRNKARASSRRTRVSSGRSMRMARRAAMASSRSASRSSSSSRASAAPIAAIPVRNRMSTLAGPSRSEGAQDRERGIESSVHHSTRDCTTAGSDDRCDWAPAKLGVRRSVTGGRGTGSSWAGERAPVANQRKKRAAEKRRAAGRLPSLAHRASPNAIRLDARGRTRELPGCLRGGRLLLLQVGLERAAEDQGVVVLVIPFAGQPERPGRGSRLRRSAFNGNGGAAVELTVPVSGQAMAPGMPAGAGVEPQGRGWG